MVELFLPYTAHLTYKYSESRLMFRSKAHFL